MNNTKQKSCRQESTGFSFWRREGDTLRPHPFDRPERLPKGYAVLETLRFQKAIAPFETASTYTLRVFSSRFA